MSVQVERSGRAVRTALETARKGPSRYVELLRVPSMSMGVYVLPEGEPDPQGPHREDETYYVLAGRGRFRNGAEDAAVGPGDLLYVPARKAHYFHSVHEELVLLVTFSPAESTG